MTVETELKLSIAPEHLSRLKRHPLLKTLAASRPVIQKLHSIYYDTPDLALHRKAMALRLRRAGRQWRQTLKGGGGVQVGLHQRTELEMPVTGMQLDLDALQAVGAKLPRGAKTKLQAVFVTEFSRSMRLLKFEGAEIELCMDSGEIRAGQKSRQISELELELKSGEPQQLFRLALLLLDIVPLQVEHINKAEYGYRLHTGAGLAVSKGKFPALEQGQGVVSALQDVIASCLMQVQANVPGAIRQLDEEYLHQVRVGLRRLRVALTMAETICADTELAALHAEVARMCTDFGRLREWDVFVTQTLAPIRASLPQQAGLHDAWRASERLRERHHAAVETLLRGPDYQRFLLRFGAWMHGGSCLAAAGKRALPLRDFAVRILQKRARQIGRRGKRLATADAAQLHALRIACKKLRYSAEVFGSLFAQAKAGRYVQSLSRLQDMLGALNDMVVARHLLGELGDKLQADARALISGWLEHDYREQKAGLAKAWKQFSAQQAFWNV